MRRRGRLFVVITAAALLLPGCGRTSVPSDFVEIPGIGQTRIDVPRPVTAPGGECAVAIPTDRSFVERVTALRAIGLFADRGNISDKDLATEIEAALLAEWGAIPEDAMLAELLVAERDRSRVWWRDLEADVADGSGVYVETIEELAAVSVGAFAPAEITETWASETGPVEVRFTVGGEVVTLEPEYLEDWIDPRLLVPINELIASSGRQFALFQAIDQTAFGMALDKDERDGLEARGWCFE